MSSISKSNQQKNNVISPVVRFGESIILKKPHDKVGYDHDGKDSSPLLDVYGIRMGTVVIPKEFDYHVIELTPRDYDEIMKELKDAGVKEETIKRLYYYKSIKGRLEYIWEQEKTTEQT